MIHPFDTAVTLEEQKAGVFMGRFPKPYMNMVGPYGGITSAMILNAVLQSPQKVGVPISMTVNFAGPIADADFEIHVTNRKTNRTNQHWYAELIQDGAIAVTATALLGVRKESWGETEAVMPEIESEGDATQLDTKHYPAWFTNYNMKVVEGGFNPFSATDELNPSDTKLYVKDHPDRALDYLSLMAMSDCFIPRIFIKQQKTSVAGTVSLTTYFHCDLDNADIPKSDFIVGEAKSNKYFQGFFDQEAKLWSKNGELLATTHQMVYFKD